MAGRGTDIKLGKGVTDGRTVAWSQAAGLDVASLTQPADPALAFEADKLAEDDEIEVGGLHIIGSERHESRRIDRQLRGRAGRQGDPGASQFFLSLEDDLMRLFNSDRIAGIMERFGAQEGEVITHALVTRSIGSAQRRVELQNFEARKRLLEYDDVMNQQREVIYDLRLFALEGGEDLKGEVREMIDQANRASVAEYLPEDAHRDEWDLAGLRNRMVLDYFLVINELPAENTAEPEFQSRDEVETLVQERVRDGFKRKLESFGEHQERILSWVLLGVIDEKWRDHLYDLDHLKASIGFRGWGQKDPLIEYKQEAFSMFADLMTDIKRTVASLSFRAQIAQPQPMPAAPRRLILTGPAETPESVPLPPRAPAPVEETRVDALDAAFGGARPISRPPASRVPAEQSSSFQSDRMDGGGPPPKPASAEPRIGRNEPCPCGSGKKYKKCHGAGAA
jgi:preprotein translocase subunit SecA